MTKQGSTSVLYAPDATSSIAMHVGHTLMLNCGQRMRALCGNKEDFTPDMVPIVGCAAVDYGYGFLRELEAGDERLGWGLVVRQYPWLECAQSVVCVSPLLEKESNARKLEVIRAFHERTRANTVRAPLSRTDKQQLRVSRQRAHKRSMF